MTARTTIAAGRRPWAAALMAAALAAALAGACSGRQFEDGLHAAGKIAYDSMKARQNQR